MIVLGLSGRIGTGKNYLADLIQANYQDVEIMAYADPLKQMTATLFNLPLADMYSQEGKKKETWMRWEDLNNPPSGKTGKMTIRDLLQFCGTDLIRNHLSDAHWCNLMLDRVSKSKAKIICIVDCRFPNEVDVFRFSNYFFRTIRLFGREGTCDASHASEAVLDTWKADIELKNDHTTSDVDLVWELEHTIPELIKLRKVVPSVDCHLGDNNE